MTKMVVIRSTKVIPASNLSYPMYYLSLLPNLSLLAHECIPALMLFFPFGVVLSSPAPSLPPLILRFPFPGVIVPLHGSFLLRMMRKGLGKVTITPSSLWAPITRTGWREREGGRLGGRKM